jgi:hypothetical protein
MNALLLMLSGNDLATQSAAGLNADQPLRRANANAPMDSWGRF